MEYQPYKEIKPRYVKMVIWRIINATIFFLSPRVIRNMLLRLFGAKIGRSCTIYPTAKIYSPWNLEISDGVVIGPGVEVYNKGKIFIGKQSVISQRAFLCTASHDVNSISMALVVKPIMIGDFVWVASRAIVLPGITIEEGGVIAAGAVVVKKVAAWRVVVGNPAREIKERKVF